MLRPHLPSFKKKPKTILFISHEPLGSACSREREFPRECPCAPRVSAAVTQTRYFPGQKVLKRLTREETGALAHTGGERESAAAAAEVGSGERERERLKQLHLRREEGKSKAQRVVLC